MCEMAEIDELAERHIDFGPCLKPPFHTLDMGGFGKLISDMEGRTLLVEHRKSEFVDELCKIMNENKERLVKAWLRK